MDNYSKMIQNRDPQKAFLTRRLKLASQMRTLPIDEGDINIANSY